MAYAHAFASVILAALTRQATSLESYCTEEDLHDDDSGEPHDMPHRVAVWMILVFIVFYSFAVGGLSIIYKCLRSGPAAAYKQAMEENKIIESSDAAADEYDPATQGWLTMPLEVVQSRNGLDAALYLMHVKQMATYCGLQMASMGLVLVLTYALVGDYETNSLTMFAWSYANIDDQNAARFVPVVASYWCVASIVIFTLKKQASMDKFKLVSDGDSHTSTNTVWIQGVSMTATQELLSSYFDSNCKNEVRKASIVWDVNELGHNIRQQKRAIMAINHLAKDAPANAAQIAELKQEIELLAKQEPMLRQRQKQCAGSAFVTFTSPQSAQTFRQNVANRSMVSEPRLGTTTWTTSMAPKPAEIYWENFGLTSQEQRNSMLYSMMLTFGMYFVFILISCGAVFFIGFDYMYYLYWMTPQSWAIDTLCPLRDAVGLFVWYGVFALSFIIAFLVMEEEMAPIIKFISKYESPLTKSIKQSSYLGKCYWFYVIYHMVLSTVILGWLSSNVIVAETDDPNTPQTGIMLYVEAIGAFHQHRVFLTVGIIDMIHLFEGKDFFNRKANSMTDRELDEFQSAEDEEDKEQENENSMDKFFNDKFDFSRNYGETIGVFTSICYYQVMHPTILFCGLCYYAAKYAIDKYQITVQYTKPQVQYGGRARTTTTYLFWSMTIGQVGNVIYYLILVEDVVVGLMMLLGLLAAAAILLIYRFQPQKLKLVKTAARAASKAESSADAEDSSAGDELEYKPPSPDDLVVSLTIAEQGEEDTPQDTTNKIPNPMIDD